MAIFNSVCCCGLKTGMILLTIFTGVGCCFAIGLNAKVLADNDHTNVNPLFRINQDEETLLLYIGIVVNGLGVICTLLSFLSTCSNDRENSRRRQCFVHPWILWCFLNVLLNIGLECWMFHRTNKNGYAFLSGSILFNTVYRIICGLIGISYIQSLNESESNDDMVVRYDTKPPAYDKIANNDGYVMMAYIPELQDPPMYTERQEDQ